MGEQTQGVGGQPTPTAQPQGVAPEGGATTQPQGVGAQTEPTAGGAQPQAPARINLDDLPEFRSWKSATDRRLSEAQKRAQEAEARAAEMASRLEDLELRELPPQEVAARYKTRLAEERAKQEQAREQQERAQALITEATATLTKLGLDPQTPGLEWGDGPSPENLARLYASAAQIVAEQNRQAAAQQAEQTEEQLREARTDALNQAGVTRVSVATQGAPPETNPIAQVRDPTALLRLGVDTAQKRERGRQPPRG